MKDTKWVPYPVTMACGSPAVGRWRMKDGKLQMRIDIELRGKAKAVHSKFSVVYDEKLP